MYLNEMLPSVFKHELRLLINVIIVFCFPRLYFEKSIVNWVLFFKYTHPSTTMVEFENANDEFENDKSPLMIVSDVLKDNKLFSKLALPKIVIDPKMNRDVSLTFKLFKIVVLLFEMVIFLFDKYIVSSVQSVSLLEQVFELLQVQLVLQSKSKHLISQMIPTKLFMQLHVPFR